MLKYDKLHGCLHLNFQSGTLVSYIKACEKLPTLNQLSKT